MTVFPSSHHLDAVAVVPEQASVHALSQAPGSTVWCASSVCTSVSWVRCTREQQHTSQRCTSSW